MSRSVWALYALALCTFAAAQYDPQLAMSSLYYSKTSYCNAGVIKSWSCAPCSFHPSFQVKNVYDPVAADSQAFTGYDAATGHIVVAFRGSSNIENWIYDLKFLKTPYTNPACPGCEVHRGFLQEWQSYAQAILQDVQALAAQYPSAGIHVTGHSLGAAVSLLAALDISTALPGTDVNVYNFGEPRVGNPAFAAWAANQLPRGQQYRITHARDPVVHLPPKNFGFLHTPHELWYDNDGSSQWSECHDNGAAEDGNCSDSKYPINVSDHLNYLGIHTDCRKNGKKSDDRSAGDKEPHVSDEDVNAYVNAVIAETGELQEADNANIAPAVPKTADDAKTARDAKLRGKRESEAVELSLE